MDISKKCTHTILLKLCGCLLSAESYLGILIFIFSNYRFSVNFCKVINDLIEEFKAKDTITPSLSGDEDEKERKSDE